jgi:multidrug resistance efflux pump
MSWANRIRLFFGLIVVVAIVAACTIVFTQRQTRAESITASIVAEEFTVGSTYPGTIATQLVSPGETVTAGQPMFEVRSPQLLRDLAAETVTPEELGVPVTAEGVYTVTSTVDGTVSEIFAPVGDFAGSGAELATVYRAQTLEVEADYALTARDYGRVTRGTSVDLLLPDDQEIHGTVSEVEVETVGGQANSTITIVSPSLSAQKMEGLYQPGTPVTATLALRDDGPLAGVTDAFRDFVRQVGL